MTFSQRRHTDGQHAYEKMLNITNQQGNTIKISIRLSPHAWLLSRSLQITNFGEENVTKVNSCTLTVGM